MKRRYRTYTAKKYKLPKRILFFGICAILIFCFALIVGNNLKKRMENADINKEPVETQDFDTPDMLDSSDKGNAEHPEEKAKVKAGYLDVDLLFVPEDDSEQKAITLKSIIDSLYAEGFNAVSFPVFENDKLTYASKATEDFSRLPASESIISFEELTDAIAYAKSKNMTTSAIFKKGNDDILDSLICSELSEIGFDEIILSGFENILTEKGGETAECIKYLKAIRSNVKDSHISLSLKPSAYTYARNSYHIEKLFSYTEFLTIDMTELDADSAGELCANIAGSFSTYMLRPLIKGEAQDIAKLLVEREITSVQYVSTIPEIEEDTTNVDTTIAE